MFYLYILIIFLCFAASIINKAARQRFLWIYFAFILLSETLIFTKILDNNFYNRANCIHIIFICWYFYKEFLDRKIYRILLTIISLINFGLLFKPDILKIDTNIFKSFVFIFLSIDWFINQVKKPDEAVIYHKMTFWISSSILLWSTVFIIRIIPGQFFADIDLNFLKLIDRFYQIITIISYLFILKGLFCKQ